MDFYCWWGAILTTVYIYKCITGNKQKRLMSYFSEELWKINKENLILILK